MEDKNVINMCSFHHVEADRGDITAVYQSAELIFSRSALELCFLRQLVLAIIFIRHNARKFSWRSTADGEPGGLAREK